MISAAPTIMAIETDSAWVVILAVSVVTMPAALLLRRLIDRPGAFSSSLLLGLPLALPLLAAMFFQKSVLPEVSVLRAFGPELFDKPDWNLLHFMFVSDGQGLVPYVFSGAPGRWLLILGLSVTSFMLLRRFAGAIALRRLVRRCSLPEPERDRPVIERVSKLATASGLKSPPRVRFLPDGVPGAFVTGGIRPIILISRSLVETLEPDELDGILAHEVAHVVARDLPVVVVAGLLRDLVAWNPLAHLALRRLVAEREFEADRYAAAITGKPLAVASSLVKMCELMRLRSRFRPTGALGFLRGRGRLRRRVSNLLALADGHVQVRSPGWVPYVAAACLAAALGLQAGAKVAEQADFAIVWDAPDTESVPLWMNSRLTPEQLAKARAAEKKPRHRKGKRVDLAGFHGRYPVFGDGYALREKDLKRWTKAVAVWGKRQGIPARTLMAEVQRSWRAVPVFSTPKIGPFGFYRIDLFMGPEPRGPQP